VLKGGGVGFSLAFMHPLTQGGELVIEAWHFWLVPPRTVPGTAAPVPDAGARTVPEFRVKFLSGETAAGLVSAGCRVRRSLWITEILDSAGR